MQRVEIEKIVRTYKNLNENGHWFDKDTLSFFNSKMPQRGFKHKDSYYFITSEKFGDNERKYTPRRLDLNTGEIETIGEFNTLDRNGAISLLREVLGCKKSDLV